MHYNLFTVGVNQIQMPDNAVRVLRGGKMLKLTLQVLPRQFAMATLLCMFLFIRAS